MMSSYPMALGSDRAIGVFSQVIFQSKAVSFQAILSSEVTVKV